MIYNYDNSARIGVPRLAYVDGKVTEGPVIEASTDEGYVVLAKRDENGYILADGEEVATYRVYGVVTVVPAIDD